MSLTRPTLLTTTSFDATQPWTLLFNVQPGGSQVVANQLTIRDQTTNDVVYQGIQNTFKYEHTIPANTLDNGGYYNASVIVYDAQGGQSLPSLSIQFRCYSAPTLEFTNIPDNNVINNASFEFAFTYSQSEGEKLNNYIVNLYNASQVLLSTSKVVYVQDGTSPFSGNYLFSGFENSTVYYIEIVGATINGAVVETGKVQITVNYKRPDLFTLIELNNNCNEGYISITSNLVIINSENNPEPPIYINDEEIDLRGDGYYVQWNQGYTINGDFLSRAWFRDPNNNSVITQFSNTAGQTIKIYYMTGYENVESPDLQAYIQVYVGSIDGMEYYIFSNYIDILPNTEYYNFYLKRVNSIYQIELLPV